MSERAILATVVSAALGACSSFATQSVPDAGPADAGSSETGTTDGEVVPSKAAKYRDMILGDQPIAYWRMAIDGGKSIPDERGKNPLVLQGGFETGVPGAIEGDPAIRFDGLTGYATATDSRPFDFPNDAPFTIECWAQHDAVTNGDIFQTLLGNSEGSPPNRNGYLLYVRPSPDLQTKFEVFANGESGAFGPAAAVGAWAYYAGVFDGKQLRLYVDAKVGTTEAPLGVMTARASTFTVGARSPNIARFPGAIDEIAVYDKALPVETITTHARAR